MLRESANYTVKGAFREKSFIKNLIYITSGTYIALKIIVKIHRVSTMCQEAPSSSQLLSYKIDLFFIEGK